jgi:hypothetical protein
MAMLNNQMVTSTAPRRFQASRGPDPTAACWPMPPETLRLPNPFHSSLQQMRRSFIKGGPDRVRFSRPLHCICNWPRHRCEGFLRLATRICKRHDSTGPSVMFVSNVQETSYPFFMLHGEDIKPEFPPKSHGSRRSSPWTSCRSIHPTVEYSEGGSSPISIVSHHSS